VLCVVLHAAPQAPQLLVVFVGVSQPSLSGAVLVQSAHPAAHAAYTHVVPLQLAPELWVASHAMPHALQFVVVSVGVSHPSVSGAVLVQSARPAAQPVYSQLVPLHVAPWLFLVSHAAPHAVQFVGVFRAPQSSPPSGPASGRMAASPPLCTSRSEPSPTVPSFVLVSAAPASAPASLPGGTLWSTPTSAVVLASQSPPLQSPFEKASSPPTAAHDATVPPSRVSAAMATRPRTYQRILGGDPRDQERAPSPHTRRAPPRTSPHLYSARSSRLAFRSARYFRTVSLVPPSVSPLTPGFKLDRYELLCPMAEGGMASVWIARQTGKHGFRRLVAVKTILPKYASEMRFQRMFIDEARIASRIEHANVAQILDVGEQHDVTYLVMEYVDGDALSKIHRELERKDMRVPPGVILRVLADVCGGLHAAHELRDDGGLLMGVVHRDVSPQNVLVSGAGVAKLIDFGIAKARDRLSGDTNADQLKGKVRYMAPEQALGRTMDRRADLWAAGALLYHLLCGKPPYEGENDMQTLFLLSSGRPPSPLPTSVHPAIAALVKRALAHAPEKRFATALELGQAIEGAMVEANVVTTTAAVAAFLAEHASERAQKRKDAIALGLKAAEERDKYAKMIHSNADASGPTTDPGSGIKTQSLRALDPPSLPTAATLGSASMEVMARGRSRGMALALTAAVVGGALGIAGLVALTTARHATGTAESVAPLAPPAPPPALVVPATTMPTTTPIASASATASAAPSAAPARPTGRPVPMGGTRPASNAKPRVNDGF
jgi:serine/threonine-protein kinase